MPELWLPAGGPPPLATPLPDEPVLGGPPPLETPFPDPAPLEWVGGGLEWGWKGAGVDTGVGVGVDAGVYVAIGAELPAELRTGFDTAGIVTGSAWPATGADAGVDVRLRFLARA